MSEEGIQTVYDKFIKRYISGAREQASEGYVVSVEFMIEMAKKMAETYCRNNGQDPSKLLEIIEKQEEEILRIAITNKNSVLW